MYKLLIIRKYLRRKLAPLFAAVAVILCTAMVIIVISVMGGFLNLMRDGAKRLTGDIMIFADANGFPHYDQLIDELVALDEVETATPVIFTSGMVKFRDTSGEPVRVVREIFGIVPKGLDNVTVYAETLYWTHEQARQIADGDPQALAMNFQPFPGAAQENPELRGAVLGIEVFPYSQRDDEGHYSIFNSALNRSVAVTVLPLTAEGVLLDPVMEQFNVVNEFKSGLYEVDGDRVYLPFAALQRMLKMDAHSEFDMESGELTGGTIPGRTSGVVLRVADGADLDQAHDTVKKTCNEFRKDDPKQPVLWSETWEERHASLLNAVQNEKGLITFLFVIISVVAVVMIATIFYMIVLEKTRDIGVLRAIGASRVGIANIFLGYGLIIGTIGALAGMGLGVGIVYNLNEIQDVLDAWFGWRMWNPQTYYFDKIPEDVNYHEAVLIAAGGVVAGVLGALIPAWIASRLDPIVALRYE